MEEDEPVNLSVRSWQSFRPLSWDTAMPTGDTRDGADTLDDEDFELVVMHSRHLVGEESGGTETSISCLPEEDEEEVLENEQNNRCPGSSTLDVTEAVGYDDEIESDL